MQLRNTIKECCMCGDLGMEKELFQCQSCLHRLQHRYCSKLYAREELNEPICDWCLDERDKNERNKRRRIEEAITREKAVIYLQQYREKAKCKAGSSPPNTESSKELPESANKGSGNLGQPSSQGKQILGEKDKRLKQRYRYKSLAQLLSLAL
eukprot:PITA_11058